MPDSRRFTNQTSAAQVLYGDYEQNHGDGANPAPKQPAGARKASATLLTGWTQPQGDPAFDPHLRDKPGETRRVDMNLGNHDHGSWTTGNLHHDFNGTMSRDHFLDIV
jgi:hypothetical protein